MIVYVIGRDVRLPAPFSRRVAGLRPAAGPRSAGARPVVFYSTGVV